MKKLFAIGLLLLIAGPSVFIVSWLHVEKMWLRKQVKQQILSGVPEADQQVFVVPKAEIFRVLEWEKTDEFIYGGQKFDVISMKPLDKNMHIVAYRDTRETRLNNKLYVATDQLFANHRHHNKTKQTWLDFLKTLYIDGNTMQPPVRCMAEIFCTAYNRYFPEYDLCEEGLPPEWMINHI